jgi:hypothetical protein
MIERLREIQKRPPGQNYEKDLHILVLLELDLRGRDAIALWYLMPGGQTKTHGAYPIVGIVRDRRSKLIDGESVAASRERRRVAAGHSPRR